MDDNRIAKLAQRLSRWQKLKEQAHVPRRVHEWAGSDRYKSQMELLRSIDDTIREELAGPKGAREGIKDDLNWAKKSLKEQKYPDVLYYVKQIDESIQKIVNEGNKLRGNVEEHIDELFGQSDIGLKNVQERFKGAGVRDWLNEYSQRRAERMMEKEKQAKIKKMRLAVGQIVNQTERIVNDILNSLKRMAAARIKGDIGQYIAEIDKISAAQSQFSQNITAVYDENIRGMVGRIQNRLHPPPKPKIEPASAATNIGTEEVEIPKEIGGESEVPQRIIETPAATKVEEESPSSATNAPTNIPTDIPGAQRITDISGYRNVISVTMPDGSIGMSLPKDKFESMVRNSQLVLDKSGYYLKGGKRFPKFIGFEDFFNHKGYYKAESAGDRIVISRYGESKYVAPDTGVAHGRNINKPVQDIDWFRQFNSSNVVMTDNQKEIIVQTTEQLFPEQAEAIRNGLDTLCLRVIDATLNGIVLRYEAKENRAVVSIAPQPVNIPSTDLWFKYNVVILHAFPSALRWNSVINPVKVAAPAGGLEEAVLDEEPVEVTSAFNGFQKTSSYREPLSSEFWIKFVQMCQRLGTDPHDMAAVINSESGFNPTAQNFAAGKYPVAQGLNQLIKPVAINGLHMSEETWENFHLMPAEEQLKWVEKYFQGKAKGRNASQLYQLNFGGYRNPDGSLYAGKAAQQSWLAAHPEDTGKFKNPGYQQLAIEQNPGLVENGRIMPTSFNKLISRGAGAFKENIDSAIKAIGNSSPPPFQEPDANWIPSGVSAQPSEIDQLISQFMSSASRRPILENKLPVSRVLISVTGSSLPYLLRYAKILSTTMRNEIDAESGIHHQAGIVEIESDIIGSMPNVVRAVTGLGQGVSEVFADMSGVKINISIKLGQSELPLVSAKTMEEGFKKFAKDVWKHE